MRYLKKASPSSIDFDIRSIEMTNDFAELKRFFRVIFVGMQSNRDFEVLQSLLNVTLKIHSDMIVANPDSFSTLLNNLLAVQQRRWNDLDNLFQKSLCLVDFVRNV
jgi:U3 small nucleolar RNA-associated protein 21